MKPLRTALVLAALAALAATALPLAARAAELQVFAAASTADVMKEVAAAWKTATGKTARVSFGSSGALARQIEAGAPADVFLSANVRWVDWLVDEGAVRPETRTTAFRNSLVLVAPADSGATAAIDPATGTYRALGGKAPGDNTPGGERIAIGDPRHVPAGIYAKQALDSMGIWAATGARSARMQNVRLALALVERGEAALGIVYRTDAIRTERVRIVADFAPGTHQPILYVAVATRNAGAEAGGDARAFLRFVRSEPATGLFREHGFVAD